ncbi:hypothetical protein OCH7691_03093 [Oceanibacterium hippocampi]|uniref:Amidohydrolase-related domain-containing protein n=2 Tax=Oceanibacterium hippocampi TaxID=745714 RepID=A0A1Y5TM57_9PROT|nr:hypothetical protein OCH7691_03093 [Oceanibacterium hippocampi]
MPGMIDAHVHVVGVAKTFSENQNWPMSLITAKAIPILENMLRRGFTTVRDAGGADWGLARAVESGLVTGPRIFFSGKAITQTGGHADMRSLTDSFVGCHCCQLPGSLGRIVDGVPELRRAIRDEFRKGATQIKLFASGGAFSSHDPITNAQFSMEELTAAVEEAFIARTYVMAHAFPDIAIDRAVRAGIRSIEHGCYITPDTARRMADKGAFLVPTLAVFDAYKEEGEAQHYPQGTIDRSTELLDRSRDAIAIGQDAGVPICFGSDVTGPFHGRQSREIFLRSEFMSPSEVLRSATVTNAEMMMLAGDLGVITPGAIADLLVLNTNPLDDISCLYAPGEDGYPRGIDMVMKDGRFIA